MKIMSRLLISGLFGLFLMGPINGMGGMDAAAKTAAPKPKTFVSVGTQTDELQTNEVQTNVGDAVSTMPVPAQSVAEIFAQHRAKYPSRYKIQQPRMRQCHGYQLCKQLRRVQHRRKSWHRRMQKPCPRITRNRAHSRLVAYKRCRHTSRPYSQWSHRARINRINKRAAQRMHPTSPRLRRAGQQIHRQMPQLVPQLPAVNVCNVSMQSEPVVPSTPLSVLLPEPTVQPTPAEELPTLPVKIDETAEPVVVQEKEQEQPLNTELQPTVIPEPMHMYPASVAQAHDMLLPEAVQKEIMAQQLAEAQKKRVVAAQPKQEQEKPAEQAPAQEQGAVAQGLTPQEAITKNLVLTLLFAPQAEQEKLLKLLSEQERKMLGHYAAKVKELVPLNPEQRQQRLETLPVTPQKVVKAILVDLDALQKEQAAVVNGQQPSTVKQAAIGIGKMLATAWVLDKVKDGLKAQLKKTSYGRQLKFLIDPAVSLAQIFGPLLFTHTAFGQKLMNGVARLLPASLQPSVSDSAMPEDELLMPPAPAPQPQALAAVPAH